MTILQLKPYFDVIDITPDFWPVQCSIVVPASKGLERWPQYPQASLPRNGRAAGGRGTCEESCIKSGMGEAVELASACRWGDENCVTARLGALSGEVFTPAELNGFAGSQIASREMWNANIAGVDWVPVQQAPKIDIQWMKAHDLTTEKDYWVPAEFVLIGAREVGDEAAISVADTNGCAAGETNDAAKLHALLELVERDATGRWWYGMRSRPMFDPDDLTGEALQICKWLQACNRSIWLFDLTTDLEIPVVAAASADPSSGAVAIGFSASVCQAQAVKNALMEMLQMMLLIESGQATGQMKNGLKLWLKNVNQDTPPIRSRGYLKPIASSEEKSAGQDLSECLDACRKSDLRIGFVNLTRREFNIPVWRAVSPDLCHWKPRFRRARLLASDAHDLAEVAQKPNPLLLSI